MSTRMPAVSFVVPCYKLAHLLGDCLESILRQTCEDFEILVMDDCSPDQTREVAASYPDRRVRYIRNDPNLGHLKNYNKGIALARGRYLWLISADDRLRDRDVLARYVKILETSPHVSFAFCPGVEIDGRGRDIGLRGSIGPGDRLLSSDEALTLLVERNRICTPSVLARRHLYFDAGLFPMDLPYAGDWYLWARFAMAGPVAYVAAPMVDYRIHEAAQTHQHLASQDDVIVRDEIAVRWRLLRAFEKAERDDMARVCVDAIVADYVDRLRPGRPSWLPGLTAEQFERSVGAHAATRTEAAFVRARSYATAADDFLERGDRETAAAFYRAAWRNERRLKYAAEYLLARLGPFGVRLRAAMSS